MAKKIPCRLLECRSSKRTPIGEVEWLTEDEMVARNRARLTSTQRWYPLSKMEAMGMVEPGKTP